MIELSPFRPLDLTLIALLNPVVILIGFWMGRRADQWQKLVVAGFAAAFVSAMMIWFAVWLGLVVAKGIGGEAGAFVLSMLFGTLWAVIGYATRSRSRP
ncbi:MAG: phosphatidylglycerophosphatase [Pseudomonadota bacterium]